MAKQKTIPLREIEVHNYEIPGGRATLSAKITEIGDLQLEGYDHGDVVEKAWGHEDYEYFVTIKEELKDTVLLHLLKDAIKDSSGFMEWLKARGIDYEFHSFP
jgi:hypothetical protein